MESRTIIDGITIPRLDRAALLAMQAGGLSATIIMSSIWDEPAAAFCNVAKIRATVSENSDLSLLVMKANDIERALATGRVGIVVGWQNTDGFGQDPRTVKLFHEAGLRTTSITFNAANAAGGGCYEPVDGGLTTIGHDLVAACNDAGILIDLTHVGDKTTADVLAASEKPVCYTHAHARALKDHRRNKSDEQIRALADKGGIIGLGALRHFLRRGLESDASDYVDAVKYVIAKVGEDHVALGSDITPGQPASFHQYTGRHKGVGNIMQSYAVSPALPGLSNYSDYPELVDSLARHLSSRQLDKFLWGNWMRLFSEVW